MNFWRSPQRLLEKIQMQKAFRFKSNSLKSFALPFIAREVIPVLEELGKDQEEAAQTFGAKGFQIFWRVTLPSIRWGLLYGVLLTNARVMGEFGAVSVVSGNIAGDTQTYLCLLKMLTNSIKLKLHSLLLQFWHC
jgi:sulfate/thiosulfate transport system permease protein